MKSTLFRRRRSQRRGALSVEMAICIPVILALFFGMWEWSRVEMIKHVCQNTCFQGARFGTLPGSTDASTEAKVLDMLEMYSVENAIVDATFNVGDGSSTVTVSVPLDSNVNVGYAFFKGKYITASMTLVQ